MEAYDAISAVSKLWLPISILGMVWLCLAHSTAGYPSGTALFTSSIPLYKDIFMSSDNIFASSTPITTTIYVHWAALLPHTPAGKQRSIGDEKDGQNFSIGSRLRYFDFGSAALRIQ
jgi:hypothetical protein